jgi:hypothetical protein
MLGTTEFYEKICGKKIIVEFFFVFDKNLEKTDMVWICGERFPRYFEPL